MYHSKDYQQARRQIIRKMQEKKHETKDTKMKVRYLGKLDTLALIENKIYEVISIERGWYRIMTELDDDYLFPPKLFEPVDD